VVVELALVVEQMMLHLELVDLVVVELEEMVMQELQEPLT
tara:strand:+ start:423 stop:542 length:120 start_codon:yes stop_codon:yes gene_type:complete